MTQHPDKTLFNARLADIIDMGSGDLAHHLNLANDRGTLLDELNYQRRSIEHSVPVFAVLSDLMDDLDGPDAAADAAADIDLPSTVYDASAPVVFKPFVVAGCRDLDPNWPSPDGKPRGPTLCILYPNCSCGRGER